LLEGREEHPVWAERAQLCHSCGSCNLVCPTCYCFDVQDDVGWDLQNGTRSRRWDGCLLSDFALVAGGHNFRHRREQRYRHRYYRKGKYLWDRMGQIACVGCGRCITACTTKIANPVDVYNALVEG
jgi:ferredoxin